MGKITGQIRFLTCAAIAAAALLFTPITAKAQDITTDLKIHWKLDEGTGTNIIDSSPSGLDVNVNTTGGIQWVDGPMGKALYLGQDSGMDDNGSSVTNAINDTLTLAFWYKDNAFIANWLALVHKIDADTRGWSINRYNATNDGMVRIDTSAGINQVPFTSLTDMFDGEWHHVAITLDNGSALGYVDGVEVGNNSYNHGTGFATPAIWFNFGNGSNGTVDDLRLYDRALTAKDIETLATATFPGKVRYNTDYRVPEYHDGYQWNAMGNPSCQSDGVWTQLGTGLATSSTGGPNSITMISDTQLAMSYQTAGGDDLRTYTWDGSSWSLTGTPLNIAGAAQYDNISLIPLSGNQIAWLNSGSGGDLRVYEWDGANWSQVGSSYTVSGGLTANGFARLNSSTLVVYQATGTLLKTLSWNGSSWSVVGNTYNIGYTANWLDLTALDEDTIVFIDHEGTNGHTLRVFDWDGTNWSPVGNTYDTGGSGSPFYLIDSLDNNTIAMVDEETDEIRTWRWSGSDWSQVGTGTSLTDTEAMTAMDERTIVVQDSFTYDELRVYRSGCSTESEMPSGLIAYWKFNETSGSATAADSSTNSNTGTLTNMDANTDWVAQGYFGAALDFEGGTQHVNAGSDTSLDDIPDDTGDGTTGMTVCGWFYPRAYDTAYSKIISKGNFELGIDTANDGYYLQVASTSGFCGGNLFPLHDGSVTTGSWHHFCYRWIGTAAPNAGANADFCHNGGSNCDSTAASGFNGAGNCSDAGSDFLISEDMDGMMADVRVYNRVLSDAEVTQIYECGLAGDCSGPVCANPVRNEGTIIYNADSDVPQYCDGENWQAMGPVPGTGGGGCSNPSKPTGSLIYNENYSVMQYCDGTDWVSIGKEPPSGGAAPTGCPNAGDLCSDGTYYLGLNPVGSVPTYMADITSETTSSWNNGTTNWVATGYSDTDDGEANTTGLAASGDAGSPYGAANYCATLSAHGHDDWYLPAKDEAIAMIYISYGNQIGDIQTDGTWYWTSSESTSSGTDKAWRRDYNFGSQTTNDKNNTFAVRCIRQHP